jgi:hypothetical protein
MKSLDPSASGCSVVEGWSLIAEKHDAGRCLHDASTL